MVRSVAGKVPPHDLDAEAAVISAALLEPEARDEAMRVLLPEHFFAESHQLVWTAVSDMVTRGEPVDAVTVAGWLRSRGKIRAIGGAAELGRLVSGTPAVVNVGAHAEIVRRKAQRRRVIRTLHELTAAGYGGDVSDEDFVAHVDRRVAEATSDRIRGNGPRLVREYLVEAVSEIKLAAKTGQQPVVPWPLSELDRLTGGGMRAGELWTIAARPGMGKAQPLDEPVLTPTGWRPMGSLRVGDYVIGANGIRTTVTHVFDRGELDLYEVTTSDGGSTRCCGDHLWTTTTRNERRRGNSWVVRTTREIEETQTRPGGGSNHAIPIMRPAQFVARSTPRLSPWLLGVWIGDGCRGGKTVRICNPESDIQDRIKENLLPGENLGCAPDGLTLSIRGSETRHHLRELGLLECGSHERFVPDEYRLGSPDVRLDFLRGLVDADGHVCLPSGRLVEVTTTSPQLRDDVRFIVGSLGGVSSVTEVIGKYRAKNGEQIVCRRAFRVRFHWIRDGPAPFTSEKHHSRWKDGPGRCRVRLIESVRRIGSAPMRCIAVAAKDNLYVTKDFIVTHNTSFADQCGHIAATPDDGRMSGWVLSSSLEMTGAEKAMRMLAGEAGVDLSALRIGQVDWNPVTPAADRLGSLPLFIDEDPATPERIAADARKLARKAEAMGSRLAMVAIDYLQILDLPPSDRRDLVIGAATRTFKQLAKELRCPVVQVAQLNRDVEKRKVPRPMLADLRDSGAIEQDSDGVIFLYRPKYYNPDADEGTEVILAKQRGGKTGTVTAMFDGARTRFIETTDRDEPNEYADDGGIDAHLDAETRSYFP